MKYGNWDEILSDILNSQLRVAQTKRDSKQSRRTKTKKCRKKPEEFSTPLKETRSTQVRFNPDRPKNDVIKIHRYICEFVLRHFWVIYITFGDDYFLIFVTDSLCNRRKRKETSRPPTEKRDTTGNVSQISPGKKKWDVIR